MFVAYDTDTEKAITGFDVNDSVSSSNSHEIDDCNRYRCLICESQLTYTESTENNPTEYFVHEGNDGDCINCGNVSRFHRLGQEVASKEIFNWVSRSHQTTTLDLESRIGSNSNFVIADIRVSKPVRVVVEVVYLSNYIGMRRRLNTIFENDYAATFIFLTNGRISPERVENHLQKISPIRIGRFDPQTMNVSFGSLITPEQIDFDKSTWQSLPEYLS